jgi:DHA2 family multidrug resistance protein
MIVGGAVNLVVTPLASMLEPRIDARLMTAIGYGLLAAGCISNGFMTPATDFWGLFWQQAVRGAALMFCVLPTTTLALDRFSSIEVPNASGLFNLMRNLGGAIALALIDTVLENRTTVYGNVLADRLMAGDAKTASFVGLPAQYLQALQSGAADPQTAQYLLAAPQTQQMIGGLARRGGLTEAFNDAWLLVGGLIVLSLGLLPLLRPVPRGSSMATAAAGGGERRPTHT